MGNQEGISRPNNKPVDSMSQDCRCGGKKAGANGWMFLTAALLIVLVIVILRLMPRPNIKEEIVPISQADKMVVTGVIRTTGLGVEDKSKLGLTFSDYQITDFGQNSLVGGYYLESGNKEIKELLGACIRIIGKTVPGWEGVKRAEEVNYLMFHRSPLIIEKFEKLVLFDCQPYFGEPTPVGPGEKKLVFKGVPAHSQRPSPDIGYDYQLKLEKPFLDKESASGSPKEVSVLDITPDTNSIWAELENNIGKKVSIEGYMVWGYSESRYLRIAKLTPLP